MKKQALKIAALGCAFAIPSLTAMADTEILTSENGYEKITEMPAALGDYFFVIVDKDNDLMMTLETGVNQEAGHKTWWYKTAADPVNDLNKVWIIEANKEPNSKENGYAFRNVKESKLLMQTEWGQAKFFRTHDQANPCEWTQFLFKYDTDGGYWTFENGKYPISSSEATKGFVGPWESGSIQDGTETAANLSEEGAGHYVIYSIKRGDFWKKVTAEVASTSDCYTLLVNGVGNSKDGWVDGTSLSPSDGNFQYQDKDDKNGGDFGCNKKGYVERWNPSNFTGTLTYTQNNLPNGHYKISAYAFTTVGGNTKFFANDKSVALDNATNLYTNPTIEDVKVTDGTLKFGLNTENANWIGITNIQLQHIGTDEMVLSEAKKEANASIEAYKSFSENSTADESAKSTYTAAIETATSEVTSASSADEVREAMAKLGAARQEYAKAVTPKDKETPLDMTFLVSYADGSAKKGWTTTGTVDVNSSQHWDGSASTKYIEPCDWGATGYDCGISQTISDLPRGTYKLTAAGRAHSEVTLTLFANDETVEYASNGDTGGTIATDGTEWKDGVESGQSAGKTFAKDNSGYGWTYQSVTVRVFDGKLTLGAKSHSTTQYSWCSIGNFKLEYLSGVDKEVLAAAIKSAGAVDIETNVGEDAFLRPKSKADAVTAAINKANEVGDQAGETEINAAIDELNEAVDAFNDAALNEPGEDEYFCMVNITNDFDHKNKALSPIFDEAKANDGDYNLKWLHAVDANYAQALKFTPVKEQKDQYTISFINEDGEARYISTQALAGYNDGSAASTRQDRIRVTKEAEKALPVEISLAGEGVYKLKNTKHGSNFGSTGNDDLFTDNKNSDLSIVKAEKATASLKIEKGWATLILPFNASVPDGLTAYTWEGATETSDEEGTSLLTLTKAEKLEANTPYIVSGNKGEHELSDYGLAIKDEYATSQMTGVYTARTAPEGAYVLQNQGSKEGFFKVGSGSSLTISPYRAYLNAGAAAGANVHGLLLTDDGTTGIDGVVNEDALVNVYDLNGILVRRNVKLGQALEGLSKGVYIVNGTKKAVK